MTAPNEPEEGAAPAKVIVPFRVGDGIFTHDEHVRVDPENADVLDARLWRDQP